MIEKIKIDSEIIEKESELLLDSLELIKINPLCEDCSTIVANDLQRESFFYADILREQYYGILQNVSEKIMSISTKFQDIDKNQANGIWE